MYERHARARLRVPETAQRISKIAASMGVTAMDPGVVLLLCSAAHGHARRTLEVRARATAHEGRWPPQLGDVELGVRALRPQVAPPPTKVAVKEAVRARNHEALPVLGAGIQLPPDTALAAPPQDASSADEKDDTSTTARTTRRRGTARRWPRSTWRS